MIIKPRTQDTKPAAVSSPVKLTMWGWVPGTNTPQQTQEAEPLGQECRPPQLQHNHKVHSGWIKPGIGQHQNEGSQRKVPFKKNYLYKIQTQTNSTFNCTTDFLKSENIIMDLTQKIRLSFKTIIKVLKYWERSVISKNVSNMEILPINMARWSLVSSNNTIS